MSVLPAKAAPDGSMQVAMKHCSAYSTHSRMAITIMARDGPCLGSFASWVSVAMAPKPT